MSHSSIRTSAGVSLEHSGLPVKMSYCLMMGAEGCATQRGTQMEQEHGALGAQMSALQELQPKEDKRKVRQKSLILLNPTPTKMVGSTKA